MPHCPHNRSQIPLTGDELKEQNTTRYETDELRALHLMGEASSTACRNFSDLGLPRHIVSLALEELANSRRLQVILRNILRVTRFKYLEDGPLLNTVCLRCGKVDSL